MIIYDSNEPSAIFRLEGSNIPRAALYSMPSVLVAVSAALCLETWPDELGFLKNMSLSQMWSATTVVIGLLLAMRTNAAYARFWEGITLVQMLRAEWFQAASNLVAFSLVALKKAPENVEIQKSVSDFHFTLVRLMSLMHGAALRQIGGDQEDFQVLDIRAIDVKSLQYLASCEEKGVNPVEVLLQWVQVLTTDSVTQGVLDVPAPILTRCFQTLSRGMVNLHDCRKLAECPFPFPLTQMVYVLLLLQTLLTPIFIASTANHIGLSACMTFLPMFGMFSITFTAGELEHPFGNDPNDLPLWRLQKEYNTSLLMLLDKETFNAPTLLRGSVQSVDALRKKYSASRVSSMTNTMGLSTIGMDLDEEDSQDDDHPYNTKPSLFSASSFCVEHSCGSSGNGENGDKNGSIIVRETSPFEHGETEPVERSTLIVPQFGDAPHGSELMPRTPPDTSQRQDQDFSQCVGVFTNVISKLWQGNPRQMPEQNPIVDATVINGNGCEQQNHLHSDCSVGKRVVSLGEMMPSTPQTTAPESLDPYEAIEGAHSFRLRAPNGRPRGILKSHIQPMQDDPSHDAVA